MSNELFWIHVHIYLLGGLVFSVLWCKMPQGNSRMDTFFHGLFIPGRRNIFNSGAQNNRKLKPKLSGIVKIGFSWFFYLFGLQDCPLQRTGQFTARRNKLRSGRTVPSTAKARWVSGLPSLRPQRWKWGCTENSTGDRLWSHCIKKIGNSWYVWHLEWQYPFRLNIEVTARRNSFADHQLQNGHQKTTYELQQPERRLMQVAALTLCSAWEKIKKTVSQTVVSKMWYQMISSIKLCSQNPWFKINYQAVWPWRPSTVSSRASPRQPPRSPKLKKNGKALVRPHWLVSNIPIVWSSTLIGQIDWSTFQLFSLVAHSTGKWWNMMTQIDGQLAEGFWMREPMWISVPVAIAKTFDIRYQQLLQNHNIRSWHTNHEFNWV